MEYPDGIVPLQSLFYIERASDKIDYATIEQECYQTIQHTGNLLRIKAPRQMGKTSLMKRVLDHARKQDYQTVYLDLGSLEEEILSDLRKLLRWLCAIVGKQLGLDNKINEYWDDDLGEITSCTEYFEEYILSGIEHNLIIGLDNIDVIFKYGNVAPKFLRMLRVWYNYLSSKEDPWQQWQQLRLIFTYSTDVYIALDANTSPFNVGIPINLRDFSAQEVVRLVQLHRLNWTEKEVTELINLIGGHPYLVRLALYELSSSQITLGNFLEKATTEEGIYRNHLQQLLLNVQQDKLHQAVQTLVQETQPIQLDSLSMFKLEGLGLIELRGNQCQLKRQLYRQYFSTHLDKI